MKTRMYIRLCAVAIIIVVVITAFLSCDRNDEIPVTTWRTTGIHRIEVEFSDTAYWEGLCLFTAGYNAGSGKTLYENNKMLENDSTGAYTERKLRRYNIYSEGTCNFMAVGISAMPRRLIAIPLKITFKGYIDDKLSNSATCEFLPEQESNVVEFRTEIRDWEYEQY